jgi:hypothetical protein
MTSAGFAVVNSARMTRSYVLLHCPSERLRSASVEGKTREMLLANPRWERRFVKFLELSGVGKTMADWMDEDGDRPTGLICTLSFLISLYLFVREGSYPETCTAEDLLCLSLPAKGGELVSFEFPIP